MEEKKKGEKKAKSLETAVSSYLTWNLNRLQVVPAKPQYSNPELQLVADEIEELNTDKLKLEAEIQQKEASIRVKNNELKNLQVRLLGLCIVCTFL